MRCPICGAKLYQKQVCKYCHITEEEIKAASNTKVKEYRKTDRKDLIHFTNVLPDDISRVKLWLYTVLLGWLGINHFYVLRNIRGSFSVVSFCGSMIFLILALTVKLNSKIAANVATLMYQIFFFMMAINIILWASDIISLLIKNFKVPVVLPKKEKNR